jgi:hypothetical protein
LTALVSLNLTMAFFFEGLPALEKMLKFIFDLTCELH